MRKSMAKRDLQFEIVMHILAIRDLLDEFEEEENEDYGEDFDVDLYKFLNKYNLNTLDIARRESKLKPLAM